MLVKDCTFDCSGDGQKKVDELMLREDVTFVGCTFNDWQGIGGSGSGIGIDFANTRASLLNCFLNGPTEVTRDGKVIKIRKNFAMVSDEPIFVDKLKYTPEMRRRISDDAKGKTIKSMEWTDADGGYWVITFTDGSELCVRLMAELALDAAPAIQAAIDAAAESGASVTAHLPSM